MYKKKIDISQKIQKYVVKWYQTYLLHPGLDQTEAIIFQYLYLPGIRAFVKKEFTICDVCQRTKQSSKTNGKLPAKMGEETPWNKLCVNIIGP